MLECYGHSNLLLEVNKVSLTVILKDMHMKREGNSEDAYKYLSVFIVSRISCLDDSFRIKLHYLILKC